MQETRETILDNLGDGPVTGPALAEQLDISRAAVWKQIEALRDAGFTIASSDDGYELTDLPEFGGLAVEYGLDTPFEIEYHESIESTNARAREIAAGDTADVVVLSDEQTGGRGRLDREWASPSGGIWLSIAIRPDVPATHAPIYTFAAAVATARAIRQLGIDASIKWPNDVLVDGAKIAGILTEMEGEADRISWLVVGIGLNANVAASDLPAGSTSIQAEYGSIDRRQVTQTILVEFHALRSNVDDVVPAWRELTSTLDRRVRVRTGREEITGRAVDIEFPGSLKIDTGQDVVSVAAGDCEHLRPVE